MASLVSDGMEQPFSTLTDGGLDQRPSIRYDLDRKTPVVILGESLSTLTPPDSEYGGALDLSIEQEGLWSIVQQRPQLSWHVIHYALRLQGSLEVNAINAAMSAIEQRHECLRATFSTVGGASVQYVQSWQEKKLEIIDISNLEDYALDHMLQLGQTQPFDLQVEPGWRVSLFRRDCLDHYMFITIHRMVSDIVSLEVIHKELAALYSAAVCGKDPFTCIQPLEIQYRDYIASQEGMSQGETDSQLEYWKAKLNGSRPAELLHDRPRPSVLSGRTSKESFTIPNDTYMQLKRYCEDSQVTLSAILLAAYRATHYRLTGVDDAVIGTLDANRGQPGYKLAVGPFENTLCYRISVEEQSSFEGIVHSVQSIAKDLNTNAGQHLPLEQIAKELYGSDRDMSRHIIAQLLFAVHFEGQQSNPTFQGLRSELILVPPTSQFDVELHFDCDDSSLTGYMLFSTDLFEPATISNVVRVLCKVLERGLEAPSTSIASLDLWDGGDRAILDHLNVLDIPITAYPRDSSVVDIFRHQALLTPKAVAVKDRSSQLTYEQLDQLSDQTASWLASRSLAPEALIGVLAPRSCETITAFMGILKANLAYLPFDISTPSGRMIDILSSIPGHKIILVGSNVKFPGLNEETELVGITETLTSPERSDNGHPINQFTNSPSPTSLAYVMFTSGSTGRPKGVMVEHRGIVRLVAGCNLADQLPKSTTMAHLTSIGFDNSTWEIYAPLLTGGTLVCIDSTTVLDCTALGECFIESGVQSAMLTPALLKQYLIGCPDAIAALESICVQGERANIEDMREARRLMGGTVINAYGPTENTVTSTFFVMNDSEQYTNGVPIGRALSNSGALVMDPNQRLVPLGVIGELVVTGDGLARGYTDSERDVDRFIFITINGESVKAYRTGDYVRYRPTDGELEFFGRIDGQVKIRGNRVELGEIEHVLRSHDRIADAVAVVQNEGQDVRLASYVTVHDIQPGSAEESTLVETWMDHWDVETYAPMDEVQLNDIGRDFIGWTSMHDGSDIDRAEMNEWLDETINTILDGGNAGHVIEIGSGSGMILFNLGVGLKSYVGLDPSGRAVDFVTKASELMPMFAGKVKVHKASAGEIRNLELANSPDIAILNSVIQYFPSQDYLFRVLQDLIAIGVTTIFLGDVRSHALHREFLTARALFIANNKNDMTRSEFKRVMDDIEKAESELLIDPAYFVGLSRRLPDIKHVEILPKRMHATNELSCFRYAAVLHISSPRRDVSIQALGASDLDWIDFEAQRLSRDSLIDLLQRSSSSTVVAISNIPDTKVILERSILESLDNEAGDLASQEDFDWIDRIRESAGTRSSLSAIDISLLAKQLNWKVELSFSRQYSQRGGMDAIFHHQNTTTLEGSRLKFQFPGDRRVRPHSSLTSQPLQRQVRRRVQDQLHQMLRAKLPRYMVPQIINFLDKMPVNQSSKVDRKRLATSGLSQKKEHNLGQKPMSRNETRIQRIWGEVLDITPSAIARTDSFFNLGGDSIAAMRVVSEARHVGIKIAVADIFRFSILHDLASQLEVFLSGAKENIMPFSLLATTSNVDSVLRNISASHDLQINTIQDVYPCTPLQEGLMIETLKRPGDYMRQAVVRLSPLVCEETLRRAWNAVVQDFPILRTMIIQDDSLGLLQVVLKEEAHWFDGSHLGLQRYLDVDKAQSMGLGQRLSRYALIKDHNGLPGWLVWTAHHALYDGWSLNLIQDAVYQAYRDTSIVIESGTQFQSFIKYIKDGDQSEATQYWQKTLSGCECVPFPSLPIHIEQPFADSVIRHTIPYPQSDLSDLTPSTLVRAAWALVMGSMTNSDDVVFGITIYGRNAPVAGLDRMIAPTIATVPVRFQIDKDMTCSEFLGKVQLEATEMIPFEQTGLQNIAKISPSAQDACKFQTQLVIQPESNNSTGCPFGEWQNGSEEQGFTTYALTLEIWLTQDHVTAIAMFDSRAIKPWLVRRLLERFQNVIYQLAEAPSRTLSEISMLVPSDLEQIWQWNATLPETISQCVHDFVQLDVKAGADPGCCAVDSWDGQLTYTQLDDLSTKLAHRLVENGVSQNVLVPLCFEKSIWTIVSIFGVLKAGGGFLLLDPSLPEPRLQNIVNQVQGGIVVASLSNEVLATRLAKQTVIVSWDLFATLENDTIACTPLNPPSPSSTMYVIFTSGSTGTPKGVVISHENYASALHHQVRHMGLTAQSRLFDFASYSFDVSLSNIFTVLAVGGCLCIPKDSDRKDNLEQSIISLEVNALDLTPSVAQLLSPANLPKVRSLTLGGEPLRLSDVTQWLGRADINIRNAYGPSECTPTSTVNHLIGAPEEATHIGRGTGAVTWIVNPNDHDDLLPPGCTGELLLEGPIVGRGYLNDVKKTSTSFISDPVWLSQGASGYQGRHGRLYKTGDLVRYDEHGNLTYICRKDEQVKIRGQRVELGEIEHLLRSQDCVDDAVVVIQDAGKQEAWFSGFVTVRDLALIQEDEPSQNEDAQQQIESWENQFDGETYMAIDNIEPTTIGRDFMGWTSMYDGSQIDNGEMHEWLDDTIKTISNIKASSGNILEIGMGSGMILFNLAKSLQSYVGLEPSKRAVDFVARAASSVPALKDKVRLFKATAADITKLVLDTTFSPSLVVINSVLQYFPSQDYLLKVIQDVIQLGSVETIFFGDVRSYALHENFLTMRALHIKRNATKAELAQIVSNLKRSEPELLLDPGFFTSLSDRLPGFIRHVEILPKIVHATNELTCYRYAAVVHLVSSNEQMYDCQITDINQESWIDFTAQKLNHRTLLDLVNSATSSKTVPIANIPYGKIATSRAIVDLIHDPSSMESKRDWQLLLSQEACHSDALSAIDLVTIAREAGYEVSVSWARQHSQHGGLDAVFYRVNKSNRSLKTLFRFPTDHHERPYKTLSSHPLRQQMETRFRDRLEKQLRAQLPSYMVPQTITILDRLPMTKNGKIDRRLLASSSQHHKERGSKQQPTTLAEKQMQEIWSEVLHVEPESIGIHDGFTQLGGNSLGAMRVVSMARQLGIELAVADMFRHSTTSIHQLLLHTTSSDGSEAEESIALVNLMTEIARHDKVIAAIQNQAIPALSEAMKPSTIAKDGLLTVLLTGANGFIGTQILRQLLEHCRVGRVIAIVRGASAVAARLRTIEAAKKAQWWTEFHSEMLEVWHGDLALPHLGLEAEKWRMITTDKVVNVIIHNGASVHFMKSYRALEAANVDSTAEMISVTASNPDMKFVYVSSARHQDPSEEVEEDVAQKIMSESNGYGQTKFVAETLVRRAAHRSPRGQSQFAVVSPGLVLGTPTEGIANADDWIWRLAAACIRVGIYNGDNSNTWIPLADAATTATAIVDAAFNASARPVIQVKGGLTFGEFWKTLIAMSYNLRASKDASECMAAIRKDIDDSGESHPLWALSSMLEDLEETENTTWAQSWREHSVSPARLKVALAKSAMFLSKVGFLPLPVKNEGAVAEVQQSMAAGMAAFTRTGV